MKKKSFLRNAILLSLLVGATTVYSPVVMAAEDVDTSGDSMEFAMEEYVVTASRTQTAKVDTPANVSTISKEQIAEQNYADATEALRAVPGVNILGSGAKGSSMGQDKILINGDERVLVLIDGRRANIGSSGNSSADWLPPVNAIERIEVLKGGGSALYGTDAVGGVINIILKKGSDIGNYVTTKVSGGSFNNEQYNITATGGNEKGLGIMVAANKEHRSNFKYKNGNGKTVTLDNSGYNDLSTIVKLDQKIGEDKSLTFNFEHINTEGGAPFSYYGFSTTDHYKRVNNNLALKYSWNEDSNANGYVQVYKNYQNANFRSPDPFNVVGFTDTTLGLEAQQNFVINDKNALTAGIEYYKTDVDNAALYGGEKGINNKAIFVEDRWKFAESWQLNTGLRFDKHSEYGSQVTPKIALNKKFNDDSNVYLSWGKVFNAPTTDDLYYNAMGMFGNPNLKAEKGDVWTLGSNLKITDKTNLAASVFYSKMDDAIDWHYDYTIRETHAINVNQEKKRGFELSMNHDFDDNLSAYLSYAYVKVEADKGYGYQKDLKAKPNIYKAGLKYKQDEWLFTLNTTTVSGQSARYFADSHYFVLDLGAQYKINKNAKLFINGYNLTNARYAEFGGLYSQTQAMYPMPARSFIVGVEYSF